VWWSATHTDVRGGDDARQVTEFMSRGSVHDLLYGSNKTSLSFKRKMLIAKQAALGMNWYAPIVCFTVRARHTRHLT
jgi:hypothetical protein